MVKCGETPLEGEGHVKTLWDSLCRMVLRKLLNTCGWIFVAWLLLQLKSRSVRGASHHPAVMGNCRTISHTLCSPIYPVDEVNEHVGSIWDNILLFCICFGVNKVHCFGLKFGARGVYLMWIVSTKMVELWGRLKYQQGDTSWVWYYLCTVVGWPHLLNMRGLMVSAARSNHRSPSLIPGRAKHQSVTFSEIVKFLLRPMMVEVEGLIELFWVLPMLQLKPGSARGVFHHTAYMGNCYNTVLALST